MSLPVAYLDQHRVQFPAATMIFSHGSQSHDGPLHPREPPLQITTVNPGASPVNVASE